MTKSNSKKAIVYLMCMSMFMTLLVGCNAKEKIGSNDSENETSSKAEITEQVEIDFWTTTGSAEARKLDENLIVRFEAANPDIKVNYDSMEGEAYKTKIKTAVAANSLPDVFSYWVGEQFRTLVSSGNIADLTTMFENDQPFKDTFVAGALEQVSYDNKKYGVPTAASCMVIWYNKRIFEENNVTAPTTYDEFNEVVNTLTENGVSAIQVGGKSRWPFLGWFTYYAAREAGPDLYFAALNGEKTFTEEPFIRAAEEIRKLSKSGFENGNLAIDAPSSHALFAAGKSAMILTGSWTTGLYTSDPETSDDFSFFLYPTVNEGNKEKDNYLYGGVSNTLAMSDASENKDAAERFLKFYMSESEQTKIVESTGNFSTVKVTPNPENMNHLAYELSEYVANDATGFLPFTDQALSPVRAEALLNALVAIVADENVDIQTELGKIE